MSENPYSPPEAKPALETSSKSVLVLIARTLGLVLMVAASLGCVASIYALLDPSGAQLSNDADPFGVPPSVLRSWLDLAAWLVLLGIGLRLFFRRWAK